MSIIKYYVALDVKELFEDIIVNLDFSHIDCGRISFFRSRGSKSKYTIARIHGLSRIWQQALNIKPHYILEVISEKYDELNDEEKAKILIHEALHLPNSFQGGFRHHRMNIYKKKIDKLYKTYKNRQ